MHAPINIAVTIIIMSDVTQWLESVDLHCMTCTLLGCIQMVGLSFLCHYHHCSHHYNQHYSHTDHSTQGPAHCSKYCWTLHCPAALWFRSIRLSNSMERNWNWWCSQLCWAWLCQSKHWHCTHWKEATQWSPYHADYFLSERSCTKFNVLCMGIPSLIVTTHTLHTACVTTWFHKLWSKRLLPKLIGQKLPPIEPHGFQGYDL